MSKKKKPEFTPEGKKFMEELNSKIMKIMYTIPPPEVMAILNNPNIVIRSWK
jgi:hypothetical protein